MQQKPASHNAAFAFLESLDPVEAFACCHDQPYSLFLDSADRAHPAARYSFIAYHPFETIEAKDGKVTVTNRDQQLVRADPFAVIRKTVWQAGA